MPPRPPRDPPRSPKRSQRDSQEAPRGSPRRPQEALRRPQDSPRGPIFTIKISISCRSGCNSHLSYQIACHMSPSGRRRGPALRAECSARAKLPRKRKRLPRTPLGPSPYTPEPFPLSPQDRSRSPSNPPKTSQRHRRCNV